MILRISMSSGLNKHIVSINSSLIQGTCCLYNKYLTMILFTISDNWHLAVK